MTIIFSRIQKRICQKDKALSHRYGKNGKNTNQKGNGNEEKR